MILKKFKVAEFRFCKICNHYNDEDAKFCNMCGQELFHIQKQKFSYIYDTKPGLIISLLAKISKADNKVITKQTANFISQCLNKIDVFYSKDYSGFREIYPMIFDLEKNGGRNISSICNQMSSLSSMEAEFIIVLFLDLIYLDGKCTKNEENLVEQIILGLKISIVAFRKLQTIYQLRYQDKNEQDYEQQDYYENDFNGKISLDEAYEILKCSKNDNFETIKKSYRTLVAQYHSDRLNSKDLPPELLKIAEEMMKKINLAYETIKRSKGM